MNLNYAIFRCEPIMTIPDLAQIGSHNKREKKAYNSNPDIKQELSKNNIELVPLTEKYVKGFYNLTNEYRKQHEEKQKTERTDRKKIFNQMLNKSRNVVADELLFTATSEFFKEMIIDDIKDWTNTCMEFVFTDIYDICNIRYSPYILNDLYDSNNFDKTSFRTNLSEWFKGRGIPSWRDKLDLLLHRLNILLHANCWIKHLDYLYMTNIG